MRKVLYLFGPLTDADVEWMARSGTLRRIAADAVVIAEGRGVDQVAIVLDGEFLVSTRMGGEVARLGVGEVIGEMSLVESMPASATVRAARDSLCLAIEKAALLDKLAADDGFGSRFYRALSMFLADRLRAASARIGPDLGAPPSETAAPAELDAAVLDQVAAAGERFQRLLRRLHAAP